MGEIYRFFLKSLCIVSVIMSFELVAAQTGNVKDADYYRSQYVKLYKSYLKDTNDVDVLVNLSRFYSDESNPMCNIPFAKKYVGRAEHIYKTMLASNAYDKELRRLIGRGITLNSLADENKKVSQMAVRKLNDEELSLVAVDQYIECFANDRQVLKLAGVQRVKTAYRTALRDNTIDAYVSFIEQYPGTEESKKAEQHIGILVDSLFVLNSNPEQIQMFLQRYEDKAEVRKAVVRYQSESAYRTACADNTSEAYKNFIEKYPSSPYTIVVLGKLDSLLDLSFSRLQTAKDYVDFALSNDGTDLADRAIDEVYRKIMEESDVMAAKLFMENFELDPRYSDVYRRFYEWHSQEGSHQLIEYFSQINPSYPFVSSVLADLNEAADIESVNFSERFDESKLGSYSEIIKTFPTKRIGYVALQRMLQNQILSGDWTAAIERCESLERYFEGYNKQSFDMLYSLLLDHQDKEGEPKSITVDGVNVFNAVITPSGSSMYYTRRSASGGEEICLALLDGGKWVSQGKIEIEGCQCDDIACFAVFDNGEKMLIGCAGDIMIAQGEGMKWRITEIPPYPINTDYIETDAFMLPDGSGMLLASDRPSGYNVQKSGMYYHGDKALATDIYYVPYTTKGWGAPVNLGFRINTCYCERFPVVSPDMKSLYFVSDCGGGLGYGDIYVSQRTDASDWRGWSQPRNLGVGTNSPFAEYGLSISRDGSTLMFCSSRDGGVGKVYSTIVDKKDVEGFSNVRFLEKQGQSDFVDCSVIDVRTGEKVRVDFAGSERSVVVRNDNLYTVSIVQKNHWTPMFDIVGGRQPQIIVEGESVSDINGQVFPLNYIKYEENETGLTVLGRTEIEQLAFFLLKNNSVSVGIIVDYPGLSVMQCHEQSLKMGEKIRSTLASCGIASERISVVGRGNVGGKSPEGKPSVAVKFVLK